MLDLGQVEHQVVAPQCCSLANGRRLSRLQVSEAETRQLAILRRELRQLVDDCDELRLHKLQRLTHQDQVGVVGDVATRRAEMNDSASRRAAIAVGVDVSHHIVPQFLFVLCGESEVDVVSGRFEFRNLSFGNLDAQFPLGLGECDPQPPPRRVLALLGPQLGHRLRGVTFDERIFVDVVTHGSLSIE